MSETPRAGSGSAGPDGASRAGFVRTVAGASAGLAWLGARAQGAAAAPGAGAYPVFSWEHVPYAAQIGKFRGDLTPSEAAFIANHFAFVAFGLGTGLGDKPPAERIQELGLYRNARAIKALNPACKTLFYWGITGNVRNYRAYDNFNPAWRVEIAPGKFRNDDANPDFRAWWASAAAGIVANDVLDGVFVDGLNPEGDKPHHVEAVRALRDAFDRLSKPALIAINGTPGGSGAQAYMESCDGFMLEQFDILGHTSPDELKRFLLTALRLGQAGKIVILKAWPSFTFMDPAYKDLTYADKAARARRDLAFPLAAFLAVVQPNCYLQYGWGWENIGGAYLLQDDMATVDPAWYPDLLKPLGERSARPRSTATRSHGASGTPRCGSTWRVARAGSTGTERAQAPANPGETLSAMPPLGAFSEALFVATALLAGLLTWFRPAYGLALVVLLDPFDFSHAAGPTTLGLPKAALAGFLLSLAVRRAPLRPLWGVAARPIALGAAAIVVATALAATQADYFSPAVREIVKAFEYLAAFAGRGRRILGRPGRTGAGGRARAVGERGGARGAGPRGHRLVFGPGVARARDHPNRGAARGPQPVGGLLRHRAARAARADVALAFALARARPRVCVRSPTC